MNVDTGTDVQATAKNPRFVIFGEGVRVVGVTYEGRQQLLEHVEAGMILSLKREPENMYDHNAIRVVHENSTLGYIPKELARYYAPTMDSGDILLARIRKVYYTGNNVCGTTIDLLRVNMD